MRRKRYRYQKGGLAMAEGGLADDEIDDEDPTGRFDSQDNSTELLGILTQSLGTTPEAKDQAKKILDYYYKGDPTKNETDFIAKMKELAESTRSTMKAELIK